MAVKILNLKLSDISKHKIMRNDYKYFKWLSDYSSNFRNTQKFTYFIEYYNKGFAFEGNDFLKEGNTIALKGINFQDDFSIDYETVEYLPEEFYDDKKYENFKVRKDEIIISLVGSIGKMVLIDKEERILLNQNNIMIKLKPEYDCRIYTYIIYLIIKDMVQNLYKVSGYSFLRVEDLLSLDIPVLTEQETNHILNILINYNNEIKNIKENQKSTYDIINQVFINEFNINEDKLNSIKKSKNINMRFNFLSLNNQNLRMSSRWNKAIKLQSEMFTNLKNCQKLGKYIISTQNGWSPSCSEGESQNAVLGIDSINKDIVLTFNNIKYTDEIKSNVENYYIKQGDLFVSRGNTPELVALASVNNFNDTEIDYIFSDLMIRINLTNEINKYYVAYVINSIIGRLYFKYVSKGKNLSMVKISSLELNEFFIPVPDIEKQNEIVIKIRDEIGKQNILKRNIEDKRNEFECILLKIIRETM